MAGMIWVKHGWADFYQGDAVDGNYAWIAGDGEGHETFNSYPPVMGGIMVTSRLKGGMEVRPMTRPTAYGRSCFWPSTAIKEGCISSAGMKTLT
jgi:hypothetical protein